MLGDFPVISEIITEYKEIRANGSGREETVQELMQDNRNEPSSEDDAVLFWIAVADAQIACKELSADIAEKGRQALATLEQLDVAWLFGKKQIEKRKFLYSQPPMPEREKIRIRKKFQCKWNIGDTFAYQLKGEEAEKYHLAGKHILLRKVDVVTESSGEVHPVVTLSIWDRVTLPETAEEFQIVPLLKLDNGRLGSSKDQYEYRIELLFSNNRQVDNLQLEFLGNFPSIEMPGDEVIFREPGKTLMVSVPNFDTMFCVFFRKDRFYRTGIAE